MPTNFFYLLHVRQASFDKSSFGRYHKLITLSGCDDKGRCVQLIVDPSSYSEKLLVQLLDPVGLAELEADPTILENVVEIADRTLFYGRMNTGYKTFRANLQYRTPVVGFNNNRVDTLLELEYNDLGCRRKLVDHLESSGLVFSSLEGRTEDDYLARVDLGKTEVIHKPDSSAARFLRHVNLQFGQWCTYQPKMNIQTTDQVDNSFLVDAITFNTTVPAPMVVPPLCMLYLDIHTHSSSSTSRRILKSDANLEGDIVSKIMFSVSRWDPVESKFSTTFGRHVVEATSLVAEYNILKSFGDTLTLYKPNIFVQWSEVYLNPLEYLYKRLGHHNQSPMQPCGTGLGLQSLFFQPETRYMGVLSQNIHPGRLRLDLQSVIKKFQTTPKLRCYTLVDVVEHPNLIKVREDLGPAVLSAPAEVVCPAMRRLVESDPIDLSMIKRVVALSRLVVDNMFVTNNLALSSECYMNLTAICENGQQKRASSYFQRFYDSSNLYVNHLQLKQPYVVVKMRREDSSYPDPPWVENSPRSELRKPSVGTTTSTTLPECTPSPKKRVSLKEMRSLVAEVVSPAILVATKRQRESKVEVAVPTKSRFTGGFVLAPERGFYTKPWELVALLDFASLYPSIIEGNRICHRRLIFNRLWMSDPKCVFEYFPINDNEAVPMIVSYDGIKVRTITDIILAAVVTNRKKIRVQMKTETDTFRLASLNAQQLSCKILQNACYGFLGSLTSDLGCIALAASVCAVGAWMNKTVRYIAMTMFPGSRTVYGDTDSILVQFATPQDLYPTEEALLRYIYACAEQVARATSKLFPHPNEVEVECFYKMMLLQNLRKVYTCLALPAKASPEGIPGWLQDSTMTMKGMSYGKRDRCSWVFNILHTLNVDILQMKSIQDCMTHFQGGLDQLEAFASNWKTLSEKDKLAALSPWKLSCELDTTYKSENVAALKLVTMIQQEQGYSPRPGNRLAFVVANFSDARLHVDSLLTLEQCAKTRTPLNYVYYIKTQLLKAATQLCQHDQQLLSAVQRVGSDAIDRFRLNARGQKTIRQIFGKAICLGSDSTRRDKRSLIS